MAHRPGPDRRPRRRLGRPRARRRRDASSTSPGSEPTSLDWVQAVADAVAKGWSREETVARVNFAERYPVDIGQGYMMNHIQTLNAGSLWDKITQARPA